jgi:hypothetical protein
MSNETREIFSTQEMRWLVVDTFEHNGVFYYYSPGVLGGAVDDGELLYDAGSEEFESTPPSHSVVGVWSCGEVVDYETYMASYRRCMDKLQG